MDELERRLRAAMIAAAEPPPPGLMVAIRRRHRRYRRRIGAGCVAVVAAIGLAAVPVAHQLSGPGLPPGGRGPATSTAPLKSPPAAGSARSGTLLVTCSDANWGRLPADWQARSLQVGPLWFAGGRQQGYVHRRMSPPRKSPGNLHGGRQAGVMIIEVADGSTVTLKAAASSRSYFQFLDGFHSGGGNRLPARDTGFTFIACPRTASAGPNGRFTDFYLGFSLQPGRSGLADIWTPATRHPTPVIFTCLSKGCGT